jgi:hypothetical protein
MTGPRKQPHSARVLGQWVDAYARERGLAPKRVRDWVSYMVLAGRLEQANSEPGGARFTIEGAVALEMRLPTSARATKDIDVIAEAEEEHELAEVLEQALADGYQDFTFRIKDDPHVMPNDSLRFQVALEYRGRSWSTVQVDLSRGEGDTTEVELVEALTLEAFGLETPPALPCLSLRYHMAQKIHGMTQPPSGGEAANERFRDLADLLLMREMATDLAGVREACVQVFALRGTHAWPPPLDPPPVWEEPFVALAGDLELPMATLAEAIEEARAFIAEIEAAVSL